MVVNFTSGTGVSNISNWAFMPTMVMNNGDVLSFYTRAPAGSTFPDRMQVRMSTNGASVNVGATDTSVGDFTTLLLDINPTLAVGGYPNVAWTQFNVPISGLGGPTSGRIAFRYFVTNGGPSGANSDIIGIDTLTYTGLTCPTPTPSANGEPDGHANCHTDCDTDGDRVAFSDAFSDTVRNSLRPLQRTRHGGQYPGLSDQSCQRRSDQPGAGNAGWLHLVQVDGHGRPSERRHLVRRGGDNS